jgi:hypothetical protein
MPRRREVPVRLRPGFNAQNVTAWFKVGERNPNGLAARGAGHTLQIAGRPVLRLFEDNGAGVGSDDGHDVDWMRADTSLVVHLGECGELVVLEKGA